MPSRHAQRSPKPRKLNLRTSILTTLAALGCFHSAALACTPDPAVDYDAFDAPYSAILRANVEALSGTPQRADGSCQTVEYHSLEILLGAAPAIFTINQCDASIMVEDYDQADPNDINFFTDVVGFEHGAEVLVGIVVEAGADPRYMVPDCWGPLHLRLDTLGDADRAEVLDLFPQTSAD